MPKIIIQPYVIKSSWLTAEAQRTQSKMVFSFAVERTAKENYSAALLRNSLILIHYYLLCYHCELPSNTPEGLILFAFRPLSGKQNKDKLCALCALSEAGGELLRKKISEPDKNF